MGEFVPTPRTVMINTIETTLAVVYYLLVISLVVFLVSQVVLAIRESIHKKKNKEEPVVWILDAWERTDDENPFLY